MSAAAKGQDKEYAVASGAKPRPEGRVRERGRRPTTRRVEFAAPGKEAARRSAIERARRADGRAAVRVQRGRQ